jgi:branched-subunit amino acid ABC-type transport system permease component
MKAYLPFLVIGLTTGAVYAIASLGLVLTYRTSGVFNFAHGAIGMFATYVFYSLRQHLPTSVAILVSVLVVAPLIGVVIDAVFRRLEGAGAAAAIVASLGLLVGLQGLAVVVYGAETRRMSPIFSTGTYRVADLNVGIDQTLVVAVAIAAGLALVAFFQRTHLGLQTRAVVDNRPLAGLTGTRPVAVTRFSWMLGCAFAATSGILFSPLVGLNSLLLTLLVVEAFGAAAVGRLRSFPRTALAAFGLGVLQSFATKIVAETGNSALNGLPSALPFLMLFCILVFSRAGSFREATAAQVASRSRRARTRRFRFPTGPVVAVVGIAAVLPPFLSGSRLLTLTTAVAFILVFASLSLLIGLSRQLSLAHAVFVVFGATTLSHLQSAGVPYLLALPLAALALAPVGAAMAIPALRLSGLYLGLATLGFGILAQNLLFPTSIAFGVDALAFIHRPLFLATDTRFYFFVLAVVVVGVVAVELVRVTRLGRFLTALADSPTAVGSLGVSPLASRVVAFCFSAFLAALAGGLLGTLVQSVNPTSFNFFQSLIWVTVLVAAGAETFGGVVLASVLLVVVPAVFTAEWVTEWQPVLFGVAAVAFAQTDNGLIGRFRLPDLSALSARNRWRLGSQRGLERYARVNGHSEPAVMGGVQ